MAMDTTRPVDEQKYSYLSYIIILSFWKYSKSSSKSSGRLSSLPQYFEKNPITYHFQCGQYNLDYHEISKSCSTTKMIKPFNNCNWINPNWECSNRSDSWTYFLRVRVNEECAASHLSALSVIPPNVRLMPTDQPAPWHRNAMFPCFINTLQSCKSAIFLTLIWVVEMLSGVVWYQRMELTRQE